MTAASVLLKTQSAIKKAVVDAVFKSECVSSGTVEQRKAAANASRAVEEEKNWEKLSLVFGLLEPFKLALENAQSNGWGLGKVRSAMLRLRSHFFSFSYPPSNAGASLKQHVMNSFLERESYAMRPVHSLAYLLDPRYVDHASQPDKHENYKALHLLRSMAAAHDVKLSLSRYNAKDEKDLPADYATSRVKTP